MKIAILWAGMGRRIQNEYKGKHKALIPINGEPLMVHLLRNIELAGYTFIVPILGYRGEEILEILDDYIFHSKYAAHSGGIRINKMHPVYNFNYENTNNLYSLMCAREELAGEEFVVINGDMVFDYRILMDIRFQRGNAIAVDTNKYPTQLDSPRVLIEKNRIIDIGRHRKIEESSGYAVGIYKFASTFSSEYFKVGRELCEKKPQAGYHEPLEQILNRVEFTPSITKQYLWMDVDEKQDVERAEKLLYNLKHQ